MEDKEGLQAIEEDSGDMVDYSTLFDDRPKE